MNSTMNTSTLATSTNPITAKMIAEKLGLAYGTVRNALSSNPGTISRSTVDKVRETAERMGYKPKFTRRPDRNQYLRHSNFPSLDAETERMLILREQGYSNAEIASKIGRKYMTVLRRIGKQDEALSQQNKLQGIMIRSQKNLRRRVFSAHKVLEHHENIVCQIQKIDAEQAELRQKREKLELELQAIASKVKQAHKLTAIDLVSLQPTPLQ